MNKKVMKMIKKFQGLVEEELVKVFTFAEEEVKEVIMDEYDMQLEVSNRKVKIIPKLPIWRDEFVKRLDEFEYVQETEEGKIAFVVPDVENFDFSGKMKVIQQIMEGTAGIVMEVSGADYETMFGQLVIPRDPIDTGVSKKETIYLMVYNSRLRAAERQAFGRRYLQKFEFSNTPPIRIFDVADKFVDEEIDSWIEEALKSATTRQRMAI